MATYHQTLFDVRAIGYTTSRDLKTTSDPRGAYIATVYAVTTPGIAGLYSERDREIVVPDRAAVRSALPARWHKAFDRSNAAWPKDGWIGSKGHMRLTGSKGQLLANLTFTSRYFGDNA